MLPEVTLDTSFSVTNNKASEKYSNSTSTSKTETYLTTLFYKISNKFYDMSDLIEDFSNLLCNIFCSIQMMSIVV